MNVCRGLVAAQATHRLQAELKEYVSSALLHLDEVGYLRLDKAGADLPYRVITQHYERDSLIVTTNKAYKQWL